MLKRMIFVLVFVRSGAASAGDWTVETVDGKPDLAGVWAAPDGTAAVAAGASGGKVYRRDQDAWKVEKTTALVDFLDVSGSGPDDVWVTGEAGGMVHWDGATWTAVMSESTGAYVAIAAAGAKAVCAVGKRISTWNGTVWRSIKDRPTVNGLTAVASLSGGKRPRFLAVGEAGLVWRITGTGPDATGKAENAGTTGDLAAVAACPTNGGDLIAVGTVAVLNRSGKWKPLAAPPVPVRGAVLKCKGKKVTHVAAVSGADLLVLDVAKGTWTREPVQSGAELTDVAAFGTGLIVSGKAGLIAIRSSWP